MRKSYAKLDEMDGDALNRLYMRVFNTPDGELVLEDLRRRGFCYTTTHSASPYDTSRNEGMRAIILTIETRLNPVIEPNHEGEEIHD